MTDEEYNQKKCKHKDLIIEIVSDTPRGCKTDFFCNNCLKSTSEYDVIFCV